MMEVRSQPRARSLPLPVLNLFGADESYREVTCESSCKSDILTAR